MAVRSARIAGVMAGAAVLAGLAAAPVSAQGLAGHPGESDRTAVAGSHPAWAAPQAKVADIDGGQQREVRVALGLRDPAGAQALAKAVTTPGSAQYRKFISPQQFLDRFGPAAETVRQVQDWLRSQGLQVGDVSANRHFVTARGSVDQLQNAFGTRLAAYRKGGLTLAAPEGEVTLPRAVRPAVTAVLGLDDGDRAVTASPHRKPGAAPTAPSAAASSQYCSRYWGEQNNADVPQKYPAGRQSNQICGYGAGQVRAIYGLTDANTGAGQTIAATGVYASKTLVEDVTQWAAEAGGTPPAPGQYTTDASGGLPANCQGGDGEEGWNHEETMDAEAVKATAPAAKFIWYASKDCSAYDGLNRAVADNKAGIITNSWSSTARDNEISQATREQFEDIAIQAAVQGQAILFSSGDAGDDSNGTREPGVNFPVSSPWVTSVGGTTVALGQDNKVAFTSGWESAANTLSGGTWVPKTGASGRFVAGAGGGVSAIYDAPDWQKGVVPSSAQGKRAIPDVSAISDPYTGMTVVMRGKKGPMGGTSLGSPIMAGIFADAQQARGVSRLGHMNPALYKLKAGLTDVTPQKAGIWTRDAQGRDELIDVDDKPQSIQSAPGFDYVAGLGTPNGDFVANFAKK
ncbi:MULTISPECIES: protease pro-enzyme activation domain-containing protein [Actinomycetes]|uniref:S53 family peptidase n=1 Tax=Actinomycetes TaxID=1760 RepID=UPI0001B55182|nr:MULTISPECIES: S53 family peptidase [Actinomycetes]